MRSLERRHLRMLIGPSDLPDEQPFGPEAYPWENGTLQALLGVTRRGVRVVASAQQQEARSRRHTARWGS
jgi:hypothetical protein